MYTCMHMIAKQKRMTLVLFVFYIVLCQFSGLAYHPCMHCTCFLFCKCAQYRPLSRISCSYPPHQTARGQTPRAMPVHQNRRCSELWIPSWRPYQGLTYRRLLFWQRPGFAPCLSDSVVTQRLLGPCEPCL